MLVFQAKIVIMLQISKSYVSIVIKDIYITVSSEPILFVIKFKIDGSLRFLSHAQMLSVFQRACVRAGMEIRYSQGFNPRPKLSLPLPRPVGVASDDELLCVRASYAQDKLQSSGYELKIKADLSEQLPEGCELLSVSIADAGASFQPCLVVYEFAVQSEFAGEKLKAKINKLLASESLNIHRSTGKKNFRGKNLDVRVFLKSIELDQNNIIVECKVSSAGSIRVEEVLNLLELDVEKLALPIRRTSVQWRIN